MIDTNDPSQPLGVTDDTNSVLSYADRLVIYDPLEPEAWIQSDTTADLAEMV